MGVKVPDVQRGTLRCTGACFHAQCMYVAGIGTPSHVLTWMGLVPPKGVVLSGPLPQLYLEGGAVCSSWRLPRGFLKIPS